MPLYNDGSNADGRNDPDSLAFVELADEYTVNLLKAVALAERPKKRGRPSPGTQTFLIGGGLAPVDPGISEPTE